MQFVVMMMKVRLFMIAFKNYSRLGACMHTANHLEGDTPRDLSVNHEFIYKEVQYPESQLPSKWQLILIIIIIHHCS
jgi:hypothetical protein